MPIDMRPVPDRQARPSTSADDSVGEVGVVGRARIWLQRPQSLAGWSSPLWRRLSLLWVWASIPVTTAVSAFVHSRDAYLIVLVVMACGAYTVPALFAAWHAVRTAPLADRISYSFLYAGLVVTIVRGLALLGGLATGWDWLLVSYVPLAAVSGGLALVGLAILVRRRSGRRALSVDVIEAVASVVAVMAPLVVLWWPAVVQAEQAWFSIGCSLIMLSGTATAYWVVLMWVRLGPGPRGVFEGSAAVAAGVGALAAALQVAQGISDFTLPAPPFIAVTALAVSGYLLIPLHVPLLVPEGMNQLPPQAQVRGRWLPTVVPLAGIAALLAATVAVSDERPWAVPFALAVVSLVAVLGGLRQMAALQETRRLYGRVEDAADERRRLLTELLERSVNDRRRVAQQLHKQAMAAYASFTTLAGSGSSAAVVAEATQLVRHDLERDADSLRELVLSIRPPQGDVQSSSRLLAPMQAYLTTVYGDHPSPQLSLTVADGLVLDWVSETVLLQVVHEALHNVWRHSEATRVAITIESTPNAAVVRIADDGTGFDPAAVADGTGMAAMRAAAAVVGGRLTVEAQPGSGTIVTAQLGPDITADPARPGAKLAAAPQSGGPGLRLVPRLPDLPH